MQGLWERSTFARHREGYGLGRGCRLLLFSWPLSSPLPSPQSQQGPLSLPAGCPPRSPGCVPWELAPWSQGARCPSRGEAGPGVGLLGTTCSLVSACFGATILVFPPAQQLTWALPPGKGPVLSTCREEEGRLAWLLGCWLLPRFHT